MKKLILTCTLLASVSMLFAQGQQTTQTNAVAPNAAASNAGRAPNPEKIAEMRAKHYQAQLGLTDAQYKEIYDAERGYMTQELAFRANGQAVPPTTEQQMMQAHDQKFQTVLTADQFAKYNQMRGSAGGRATGATETPTASPANH